MLNLPNFLTLIRIVAIPFFLVLLASRLYLDALVIFILGGVTDALDGFIARTTNQKTSLGAHLDPVADKLLLMSSFVMLAAIEAIPQWFMVLVVSRDIVILLGYIVIYLRVEERLEVQPTVVGKVNTILQLLTVGVILIMLSNGQLQEAWLDDVLIYGTAATTVISGLQYIYRGLLWLQNRVVS